MGTAGILIGGGLLGVGAAALASKKNKYSMSSDTHSSMTASQPEVPETPLSATPESGDTSTTDNAQMEAEREKERQAALLRQQRAQEVFTSGLGADGSASTAKKSLLGG